jgi:hypothetical protein
MGSFPFVELEYAVYAGDVRSCSFHQTRFGESTEEAGLHMALYEVRRVSEFE